ncbi:MAG: hypothetical protein J0I29_01430 [Rhizobiales bacterium]|nr:hypothetical protein [Hyphomicrobiales bacterium]
MTLFLTLAPFGTFASLMMLSGVQVALAASAVVALAVFGWDAIRGRSLKILTGGAFVVFAALLAHHQIAEQALTPTQVRIALDSGMLAIALGSLALRFPFTLQYAREAVEPEILEQPSFRRANYIITWVWIGAMTLMLIADIVSTYIPSTPLWTGAAIAFAARNGAGLFTQWYPKRVRAAAEGTALKPA